MTIGPGLGIEYNPTKDFTPEGREEIYKLYKGLLKEADEDALLFENEKKELKRRINIEMQIYEGKYDAYQENIGIVKKLFLKEKINSFSLN